MGRIQPGCLGRFRHVCMGLLIVVSYALGQSSPQPTFPSNPSSEAQGGITSRLFTLSRLGPEHLANAAYRKGAERNSCIVAWRDRLLQWPLAKNGAMREVYPRQEDWRYNNGGCAWDMDGDGVAEIVVAEAEIPEARLAIFKRGADATKLWQTHRLDKGLYAPHSLEVTDAGEDGDYDIIADEIQLWKFSEMDTHVGFWLIVPPHRSPL